MTLRTKLQLMLGVEALLVLMHLALHGRSNDMAVSAQFDE
jgi:hypothetical protein